MNKRIKKKLVKRYGYKKYSNKNIKLVKVSRYVLIKNEEVFRQLYMDHIMFGQCMFIHNQDLTITRIDPYSQYLPEGVEIYVSG